MSGCERYEDDLVELALGTVAVEDRAAVLRHVATCRACEARLAEHTRAVDSLLAVAPEAEPPAGFEARVAEAMEHDGRPHRRRARPRPRRALAVAAAVVALLGAGIAVGALGTLRATDADRTAGRAYRADLAEAGGKYFGAYRLTAAVPGARGVTFGYEGDPSWVLVTATGVDGPLRVEVEGKAGTVTGTASPVDDTWSWGGALPFPLPDIQEVRVVRGDGAVVLHLAR